MSHQQKLEELHYFLENRINDRFEKQESLNVLNIVETAGRMFFHASRLWCSRRYKGLKPRILEDFSSSEAFISHCVWRRFEELKKMSRCTRCSKKDPTTKGGTMPTQLNAWQCDICQSLGSYEEAEKCEKKGLPSPEFKVGDTIPYVRIDELAEKDEDALTSQEAEVVFGHVENFQSTVKKDTVGMHRWVYYIWFEKPKPTMLLTGAEELAKKEGETRTPTEIMTEYNGSVAIHGLLQAVIFRTTEEMGDINGELPTGYISSRRNIVDGRVLDAMKEDVPQKILETIGA